MATPTPERPWSRATRRPEHTPASDAAHRTPSWSLTHLHRGATRQRVDAGEIGLAETNGRSILGVMNEFAHFADWRKDEIVSDHDLIALALELAETPTSPLYKRHVSPDRELAAAVAETL